MKSRLARIESLEPRIAPASTSITYTDVDGDRVKITASKPGSTAPPLDLFDTAFVGGDSNGQLKLLALTEEGYDGASIKFSVTKRGSGGDGRVHVGFINAAGVDLDKVIIPGDLGRINSGDATTTDDPGLRLLQVHSFGTLGLVPQGGEGHLRSVIAGGLDALKVKDDFVDAELNAGEIGSVFIGGDFAGTKEGAGDINAGIIGNVTIRGDMLGIGGEDSARIASVGTIGDVRIGGDVVGTASGSGLISASTRMGDLWIKGDLKGGYVGAPHEMGVVTIGGSVLGGATEGSGNIRSNFIHSVKVGGNIVGGPAKYSGWITGIGSIERASIKGSIIGGSAEYSGLISSANIDGIRVGGSVIGGSGTFSGQIATLGTMGDVYVAGDVIGGTGSGSGQIVSVEIMGHVRIGGSLIGGNAAGDASVFDSGEIFAGYHIASVTISGSLIAGADASTGTLVRSGAIVAGDHLGPVKIGGDVVGNALNPAVIRAEGQRTKPTTGFDMAIASLTVGGDVVHAAIGGGQNIDATVTNADAAIGAVRVGGDWVGSVLMTGRPDLGLPSDTALIARVASVTIKGKLTFTDTRPLLMLVEQIDRFRLGSVVATLADGPGNDVLLDPATGKIFLTEVHA